MDANTPISRRIVFTGLGSLGVAAALAGCGTTQASSPASSTQSSAPTTGGSTGSSGAALASAAEIPVGGGIILTDQQIVITQPTQGTFDAFSAVCTHQGFTVTSVSNGTIACDHHGSTYSAATGQVTGGPAPSALSAVAIKVKGGNIFAA